MSYIVTFHLTVANEAIVLPLIRDDSKVSPRFLIEYLVNQGCRVPVEDVLVKLEGKGQSVTHQDFKLR